MKEACFSLREMRHKIAPLIAGPSNDFGATYDAGQVMCDSKTDKKNIELGKLLVQLRDHIDVHRIISLNAKELRGGQISRALLSYLQRSAHESLAVYFCKVFEESYPKKSNSIRGVIESISPGSVSEMHWRKLETFGEKYGYSEIPADTKSYLNNTFRRFHDAHSDSLKLLKKYRDKIGAHSDSRANISSLPSHDEFETLFRFAKDFHEVVSYSIIGVENAVLRRKVGSGFIKLLEAHGVQNLSFDFKDEK